MPVGDILGGAGEALGGIAVLAGAAGKGGERTQKQIVDLWRKLEESNFDYRALTAPQLRVLAEAVPELYTAIVPEEAQQITEAPEGREAQLEALGQVQEVAREGLPAVDRVSQMQMQQAALQAGRGARESALQGLAARGALGGGAELAARAGAGSEAANVAAGMANEAIRDAALRRLTAAGQAGQMGGTMREQDLAKQLAQAGFSERFNELVARMKTEQARENAGARERAQAYNIQTRQRVGETNPMLAYQTALQNLERQNALKQAAFGQRAQKTAGMAGAMGGLAGMEQAQQKARAQAITGLGRGVGQTAGGILGFGF